MKPRLHYGPPAKLLHWVMVALLAMQYPIGRLMPDIHRGEQPGVGMNLHVSFGIVIVVLTVLRFFWRLSHPVAPVCILPNWQRLGSELVHGSFTSWCWRRQYRAGCLHRFAAGRLRFSAYFPCRCLPPKMRPRSTACTRRLNGRCSSSSACM
jgi:hypothetical protein